MKNVFLYLMCISFPHTLFSQIAEKPVFEYEYISWKQHVNTVKTYLSDKHLVRLEQSRNPIFKRPKEETFILAYTDTIFTEIVSIGLQFTVKDSLLKLVQISYLGINSETKRQYEDIDERLDSLTAKYTSHFGNRFEEKSVPFVGKIRSWEFVSSDVQMLTLTSVSNLIIQYSPREH